MGFNTALIVDDSKLARVALKRKLEQRGLQIVMAEDARQALDLLQSTPVDIVFMDHLMPEMDGFQATQEIKGNTATAHLPVIMCSGKEKQGYLEEARAIGASNVLPKPAENAAIDAVFAALEQAEVHAPAAAANVASAPVAAAPGEAELASLMQPLVERIEALAAQFNALAGHADERFATVADSIHSLSEREAPTLDMENLDAAWDAKLEQRIGALALPDTEILQAQLEQNLSSSLDQQWQGKLTAVADDIEKLQAGLERADKLVQANASHGSQLQQWHGEAEERIVQNLTELMAQSAQQRDEKMDAAIAQQMSALRADCEKQIAEASESVTLPELNVEEIRASLKAEIIDQLKVEMPEPASSPDRDIDALRESLVADIVEQLKDSQQSEAMAPSSELDIDELRRTIVADVVEQLQAKAPANLAELADDALVDGLVDQAEASDELERIDISEATNALASRSLQLQHEFKVLKMLGLISSIVAATSIALHWL
jgi:CheY-like chemotaxis protein